MAKYCLKVSIASNYETRMVPKLLLHVSFQKLNNSIVNPPKECGLKEARVAENNIIISCSTLFNTLSPLLEKYV